MAPLCPASDGVTEDAIAVVGMSCRFPGNADNIENFWEMIRDGKDAWSEIPSDRFNIKGWYHPDPNRPGSFHIRGAHFIKEDIAAFDAPFFSISTAEAVSMDPQQRMLLEVVYEALDSAGIPMASLSNSATSVFCGSFVRDYEQPCMRDPDTTPPYSATGNGIAILANRISHAFDFAGTSQTIDTGCSASMIAVHQACKSLLSKESDIGIAAGVGLIFSPNTLVPMANLNILGSDGRCYTFDDRANGYGRGEGAGVVVLKRLKDAIASNDTIRAVIRATASNQDGHTQGITLPSKARQVQNMTDIYRNSGLDLRRTAYMECHGTGTQVGDVKETQAAAELFCKHRSVDNPLIIGSVKTNIGHLEGSAGVAGLIKGVLVVERGFIPKHLNFRSPNKKIDMERMRLKIATDLMPWPIPGLRRASVNSFGFGGTNAHIVLDDVHHFLSERYIAGGHHATHLFPEDKLRNEAAKSTLARSNHLFVFSGHDEAGLTRVLKSQADYISKKIPENGLEKNYAYTLLSRRSHLNWRSFFVASSLAELLDQMQNDSKAEAVRAAHSTPKGLALIFCGQGAQWYAMGRELLQYQVFYTSIATASWYMASVLGSPFCLWDEIHKSKDTSRISDAQISQPATTAIQVALVDLIISAGLTPTSVLGHSSGEIAAAYAAGALHREDAWKIAYFRGQSVSRLLQLEPEARGAMLAVAISEDNARRQISDAPVSSVDVACVNGPTSVTLSGAREEIDLLHDFFKNRGFRATRVNVETAYHSKFMRPIEGHYRDLLSGIGTPIPTSHNTAFYSSVFGREISTAELDGEYWVKNLIQPVQFYSAAKALVKGSHPDAFLEVSPHRVWESSLRQIYNSSRDENPDISLAEPSFAPLLVRDQDASMTTLVALGKLWAQGFTLELHWPTTSCHQGELPCHLIDVPSYPWDHSKRFWHESHLSKANRFRSHGREDIIGAPLENSTPQDPRWRGFFRIQENPWLADHVIQKSIIYPAGGMIAMAIEASKQLANRNRVVLGYEVTNFKIIKPMLIPTSAHGLENILSAHIVEGDDHNVSETVYAFSIQSKALDGPWTTHARGHFSVVYCKDGANPTAELERLLAVKAHRQACQYVQKSCHTQVIPRQFYETLDVIGMTYGPQFRNLAEISKGDTAAYAVIEIPDTKSRMPYNFEFEHVIHPATLDTMLQTVMAVGDDQKPMLPSSVGRVFVSATPPSGSGSRFRGYTTARNVESREAIANVTMFDDKLLAPAVIFEDLRFRAVSQRNTPGSGEYLPSNRSLCSEIVWKQDASIISKLGFDIPTNIEEIVDLASHKIPSLSILYHVSSAHNIGDLGIDISKERIRNLSSIAEALKITKLILDVLTAGYETPRFSRCQVTGISSDRVLQHLRTIEKSSHVFDRVKQAEALPVDGKYHLVFCSVNESSTTDCLSKCLNLVEDDGWLIMLSTMGGHIDVAQYSKCKSLIQAAGFRTDEAKQGGPFIAAQQVTRQPQVSAVPARRCSRITVLLPTEMSPLVCKLKSIIRPLLESQLRLEYYEADISTVEEACGESNNSIILSLVEIGSPLISKMAPRVFDTLHSLLTQTRGILWLTQGGQVDCQNPDRSAFVGLVRSLRSEDSKKRIVTLDIGIDSHISSTQNEANESLVVPETLVSSIIYLIQEQLLSMTLKAAHLHSGDVEFAYHGAHLMIPRLMPLELLNRSVEQGSIVRKAPLLSRGQALRIDADTVNTLDEPRFLDDSEVLDRQLDFNQVRIAIACTHLLPEDIIAFANNTTQEKMGTDIFGYVIETGPGVVEILPGSYVVARMRGTIRTHVIVDADRVRRIDPPSSWQSSCPTAFATAIYALYTGRRITKGDSILVFGLSSVYGQAAIRVATALGSNVLVACTTADEKFIAQEHFKISPSHVLEMAGAGDLQTRVLALTHQLGVDVVFDPTSCYIEQAFSSVAECGRIIRIALNDGGVSLRNLADKNVSFETIDIHLLETRRPSEAKRLFVDVDKMLQLHPGLDSVCCTTEHNMRDLKAALIQASDTPFLGSHVLFTEADKGGNLVSVHVQSASKAALSSSVTYLLVGGLGGLGRSIAKHLVRRGAKHIAFISRSGASSLPAKYMLAKMQAAGIDARVFATDVCSEKQLAASLGELQSTMPPIRGAIQCAAIVDDALFPGMNYDRWKRSFDPKAIGSINLHEQLPRDMDFFIFLSSSSGVIGNRGQANYSAGNCLQDALARHRTTLGMHSVSINLGLVLGAGMVAENESLLDAMKSSGFIGIRMQDALSVLDRAMDCADVRTRLSVPAQIVTAVGTGGLTIQNEPSDPFWTQTALFRYLNQVDAPPHGLNSEARHKAGQHLQSAIRASPTLEEASQIACTALVTTMARRKGMIPDDFDLYQSFDSYGIDSLDSMFLLGWISRETGVTVQTVEGVTIAELGQNIARRSRQAIEEERQPCF